MDFTVEQFLGMFERYNDAIWPMQIVVYGVGLIIVGLLCSRWRHAGRAVLLILAAMWTWLGAVFMLGSRRISAFPATPSERSSWSARGCWW